MDQGFSAAGTPEHGPVGVGAVAPGYLPQLQDFLGLVKKMPVHNGGMGIFHPEHGQLTGVADLLMIQMVRNKGLLQQGIPNVLFVFQHPVDLQPLPAAPGGGLDGSYRHIPHDLQGQLPMDIPLKNLPHHRRLLFVNQIQLLVPVVKAVKGDLDLLPRLKALADGPLHIFGYTAALLLGKGCHNGQEHFRKGIRRVNALFFKKHMDSILLQLPHRRQGVHGVSGEAADAFGNDIVDFSGLAVLQHFQESGPVLQGGPAAAFIGVDAHQLPVLPPGQLKPKSLHLVFQAVELGILLCAHPTVGGHPLENDLLPGLNFRYSGHWVPPPFFCCCAAPPD